ncbi:unnamed protein product [Prunus armeniaca]
MESKGVPLKQGIVIRRHCVLNGITFSFNNLKVVSQTSSQVRNDSSDLDLCFEDDDNSDPDFEDSDYAQSDEEIYLLKKDDKWFEGYVDHTCTNNDPNAEENNESDGGEESPTLTCPSSSSSEDEALGKLRRKRSRMSKGEDFIPEIDMANPGFKSKFTKTMVIDHLEQQCIEQKPWQLTL